MARSRYVREKPLTLAEQGYFLKATFPGFRVETMRSELRCVGELRPTSTSDSYTIQLIYKIPTRPEVHVINPPLRLAPGCSRLPHVFDGNELCLYVDGEWRPDLRISHFVVPWISEWLSFYEDWLATGEWLGGGHDLGAGKK